VELSYRAADKFGWLCRSTAYNPLTAEGKKTVALEIAEELGWAAPDVVVVPAGDGNIVVGAYRGFVDALRMGWISALPRLVAVQSERAPALHHAWLRGADDVAEMAATSTADSINVAMPQDGFRALRAVRDTGGVFVTVPDEAMNRAARELATLSGVFAEPAGAAPLAALPSLRASGAVTSSDTVVLISTGSGLKSQHALPAGPVHVVDARLDAIEEAALAIGADG
jgi:threonine synthase